VRAGQQIPSQLAKEEDHQLLGGARLAGVVGRIGMHVMVCVRCECKERYSIGNTIGCVAAFPYTGNKSYQGFILRVILK